LPVINNSGSRIPQSACMLIPLDSHMYRLAVVGEQLDHWAAHGCKRRVLDNKNLCAYELTERVREIVEQPVPKTINPAYSIEYVDGKGVCLRVPDHGFGRGLMRLLFGWKYVCSAPKGEIADKVEALLRKSARGPWMRTKLYGSSAWMEAFNLENEEDLHLAQLSFCQIEAKLTRLPFMGEQVMDVPEPIEDEEEETDY
jgi:hypothetical protein